MRYFASDFRRIGKRFVFNIAVIFLCASCILDIDQYPTPTILDQGTPTDGIHTIPADDSGSNDKQPQSDEERIAQEFIDSGGQFTASAASCNEILKVEPWCIVITSTDQISKLEWEELFPTTLLYVVRTILDGGEVPFQNNMLVVEQDGNRYSVGSFQRLLDANTVEISEENRELVAKSLVLMMLPDFIEHEVHFLAWEEGEWRSPIRANFNYGLTLWTELGGFEMQWLFLFYDGELLGAEGWIVEEEIGNYTAIPMEGPKSPSPEELVSWNR